ncbi:fungal-specific transcription factor domain-containing protein [Ilyonectria robusta]|uniref:fungal-specific transcription factor domain-containing protein n=1 Tax=Ilyonectria robusta TaxID=1079257 RepID=UPI001E8CE62C|nr:fungal-specific transcription factor domain-containing protein [Ilyonectria robusta]KAH8684961.1 fungal-specific transcription factor domain-containing protein [Ilyonectria robusta]
MISAPRELSETGSSIRYGFSRRLVKPLLKVARLIRARQNEDVSPGRYPGLEAEIDALEIELLQARDADIAALSASHQDDGNLLHLNEAVYSAAVIIFYTRMRDMPWTSALIRSHVQTACSELSHLDLQSPISRAVIFPYYFAGCEAVGSSTRETIRKQVSYLPDTWFNRGSRILQCLEHVWAIRDEVPGAPWISWSRKVSSEYADCIPVDVYREPKTFRLSQRNSNCTICHPAVSEHEKQSRRHMLPPYFPQRAPFPLLCLLYF